VFARAGACGRWLVRASYVVVLLGLLWIGWIERVRDSNQSTMVQAIRQALTVFHVNFAICQLLAVSLLGPVFAASSLVEERAGRTLMLILASRVADQEIVTAKLLAALSRVGDALLCGLPFSAICVLFGAVQPETVVAELLLAISTAFAGSALALLIALWCRRLVDSLIFTYLVQGLWFSLPAINFIAVLLGPWPMVPDALLRLNVLRATANLASDAAGLWWAVWAAPAATMVGFGVVLWLAAIVLVRPASYRVEFGGVQRLENLNRVWRWGVAVAEVSRSVWDRPVLWRELRCRRATWVERLVWFVFIAAGVVVIALIVREWPSSVLAMTTPAVGGPPPLVCIISAVATFGHLAFLAFPFLAVAGATGFADERDGRMDEFLRLTDLRHSEMVNAKLVRLALFGLVLLMPPMLLTAVMVAIGYLTWMGSLLVTANCLASLAFAALLGLAIGVRSRKTSHAVATTIVVGLVGGFLIPVLSVLSVRGGPSFTQYALVMMSPPIQCYFLMFYDSVRGDLTPEISRVAMRTVALAWTVAFGLASLGLYLSSLRVAARDESSG
jgi:hypothetical protein